VKRLRAELKWERARRDVAEREAKHCVSDYNREVQLAWKMGHTIGKQEGLSECAGAANGAGQG
jgi:hypothetical protein